jgi:hypothetical protein
MNMTTRSETSFLNNARSVRPMGGVIAAPA